MEREEIEALVDSMFGDVPEVIHEIFARMRWGEKFILANGRTAYLKKFYEPKKDEDEKWCFGFDVCFEDNGTPDHLEFKVVHVGGGGYVPDETSIDIH